MAKLGSLEYWRAVGDNYNNDERSSKIHNTGSMIYRWGDLPPVYMELKNGVASLREATFQDTSIFEIEGSYEALVKIYQGQDDELQASMDGRIKLKGPIEKAFIWAYFLKLWGDWQRKTPAEI